MAQTLGCKLVWGLVVCGGVQRWLLGVELGGVGLGGLRCRVLGVECAGAGWVV